MISPEVLPPNETPETTKSEQIAKRNRLIGVFVLAALGTLAAVIGWQIYKQKNPPVAADFETLAVLPFEPAGENQSDLQIGLADAMITNLSKIKQLKVLPLALVRQLAGQKFDVLAVGKELKTDAVLSGTYRLDNENVRVTVNLLRVAGGQTIWTETFSMPGKNGLEIENSIALRTARLLSLKIAEIEDEKSLVNQKHNPEAVQNYLSARKIWRAGELFRRKEMIGLFEKTIELEPNWALAYAGYAEILLTSDQLLVEWEKAAQIAKKAIELDPALSQPHAVLGEIYRWRDWNWEKAETEFRQSITLNPNDALSYFKFSQLLRLQRRFAEAEEQLNKAVEIEPFSPLYHASFCELYTFDRKFDKALAACNYVRQIEPDFWWTPKLLHWLYIQRKMYAELDALLLSKLSPTEKANDPLAKALAQNDLRPYFQHWIDEASRSGRENLVPKAMYYVQLGEKEKALENLEKALAVRDATLPSVNADSMFDSIRNDKRFAAIMSKTGLLK